MSKSADIRLIKNAFTLGVSHPNNALLAPPVDMYEIKTIFTRTGMCSALFLSTRF